MLYVLRYTLPLGPELQSFVEATYDEVIAVKNGIALCQFEHNKQCLLARGGYEFLGTINAESELKDLLEKDRNKEFSLDVKKEVLSYKDVLKDERYSADKDEQDIPWYKNLE